MPISENNLEPLLKENFGFSSFRPGQEQIIRKILNGQNVLSVMPTGAGKSLCYQFPASISDFKTIIVCPLVALIDDQHSSLKLLGIPANKLHSHLAREVAVQHWLEFKDGNSGILFLSPERLLQQRMLDALSNLNIGLFVIDEAHCISKWGSDFRPQYAELSRLKDVFLTATIAAFTATADSATQKDIVAKLTHNDCDVTVTGFDRPNLSLAVMQKANVKLQITEFLKNRDKDSGIIYCLSRKETEELADYLRQRGFNAHCYHAGKTTEERQEAQNRFMSDESVIMVATIAFGMGIDKPDIRFVIHASLPSSVEAFYQEIGRAGRDGNASDTVLFYNLQDIIKRRQMIEGGSADDDHKLLEAKRLDSLVGYCETSECRRLALLSYFDDAAVECGNCDNCINPPQTEDYTEIAVVILQAIRDTGQYFGSAHIIDVVRGARTSKILERDHDQISSYSKAKNFRKPELQNLVTQLSAQGFIKVNLEKHAALNILDKGYALLNGETGFSAKRPKVAKSEKNRPAKSSNASQAKSTRDYDQNLFTELKKLRLALAKDLAVPAFVIFPDRTLIEIAKHQPKTAEEFLSINGVGQKKLDDFYEPFSKLLAEFSSGELEKSYDKPDENEANTSAVAVSPIGDYFKIETLETFTPLNKRSSTSIQDDLEKLAIKRNENIQDGNLINHGMPFSEEELAVLCELFENGWTITHLSDFFQRTPASLITRLVAAEKTVNHADIEEFLPSMLSQD